MSATRGTEGVGRLASDSFLFEVGQKVESGLFNGLRYTFLKRSYGKSLAKKRQRCIGARALSSLAK